MIKGFEKIFIVLLIVSLAFGIVGLNYSYATEATLTISSAKVNQEFTVKVNIPSEAVGYQGKIEVTFSDKTTLSSGKLVKMTGLDGDYSHPGNMSAKFKASSAGTATVKVTGLVITNEKEEQVNKNTEITQTINVEAEKVEQPTTPSAPTQQPTTSTTPSTSPDTSTSTEPGYRLTGDTVYALEKLNVRKSASTSAEKLGQLAKGASTKRIAVGDNGWDKIEYNGTTGYVATQYLTTQKPGTTVENTATNEVSNTTNENKVADNKVVEPAWTATGDTVYSLKSLNVREGWGTSFKSIGGLSVGQKVKRVAVGSNGWDKIQYEGKDAYVLSKHLTTSKEEVDKLLEEKKNAENEIANNTTVNNTVENSAIDNTNVTENTMTNEEMYNMLVDEIGVIPQVGRSIIDYIYIIGVIAGLISIGFVSTKIHEKNEE